MSRRIKLKTSPETGLDGYLFADLDHARHWLSQDYVKDTDYRVHVVEIEDAGKCKHCGHDIEGSQRIVKGFSPSEFLALTDTEIEKL